MANGVFNQKLYHDEVMTGEDESQKVPESAAGAIVFSFLLGFELLVGLILGLAPFVMNLR
jgi:hypothetical protein